MPVRGQSAADYLLATGFIIALLLVLALPVLREGEVTLALGGARSAAWAYLSSNATLSLDAVDYGSVGNKVTIHPHVFFNSIPYGNDLSLRNAMIAGVGSALAPGSVIDYANGCVSSVFNTYCVQVA